MSGQFIEKTYNCDDITNFVVSDDTKLEVSQAAFKLILQLLTGQTYTEDCTDGTGWTYTASKSEFSGGKHQQKDQTPADSIFGGLFSSLDLNWHKSGSTTHTKYNTPVLSGGKVQCFGANGIYYGYTTQAIEVYKVKYSPNYNSVPVGANADVINSCNGVDFNDKVIVYHGKSGDYFRATVYDDAGVVVFSGLFSGAGIGAASGFTTSSTHELMIEVNSTAGTLKLWIGGTLKFTASPGAWDRGGVSSRLYLGANPSGNNNAEASYDDIIPYSAVQETGSYTPGYTIPSTIYAETYSDMPTFAYPGAGAIQTYTGFSAVISSSPRFVVNGKYPVGGIWQASDKSYAQAVTAANVQQYFGNLLVSANTIVTVVFPDSNDQQWIDDMTLTYTGQEYDKTSPYFDPKPTDRMSMEELLDFLLTITEPGNSAVRVALEDDDQLRYHTGSAWADSNGSVSQANTGAEILANKASFVTQGSLVGFRCFLTSNDGLTTPTVSSLYFQYNNYAPPDTAPDTTNVHGEVYSQTGSLLENVKVEAYLMDQATYGSRLTVSDTPVGSDTTNALGYWDMALVDTDGMKAGTFYRFKFTYPDGTIKYRDRQVPQKDTITDYDPNAENSLSFSKLPEVEF